MASPATSTYLPTLEVPHEREGVGQTRVGVRGTEPHHRPLPGTPHQLAGQDVRHRRRGGQHGQAVGHADRLEMGTWTHVSNLLAKSVKSED